MAVLKCKMCGGDLILVENASTAACEYCGSVQTIPKLDDEKKLALFARANRLRAACEFDKAAGIYESIVEDFPEEAEAYWGLVLCKYGIEYVDDPATGRKIPTCHRSAFTSVLKDTDLEQALENADVAACRVYREEAKAIEALRTGIIAVSANEAPYDIFICYKETDENGQRTLDSVLAQDVYDALTGKGYRVFFSRISLEDKLGVEYEPYIFAALNSARIMLVFGTDYVYFNAVWVKNEWSRFLKLMASDKEKHLIPCYKGIDAYDMPEEFARLQAQDLGKLGAVQDLLRGIEKLLPRQAQPAPAPAPAAPVSADPVTPLLKRAYLFLDDGDWSAADEYCEKVLDMDPENGEAYLIKLLSELKLQNHTQLQDYPHDFSENKQYRKALRFAAPELRSVLEGYAQGTGSRIWKTYKQRKALADSVQGMLDTASFHTVAVQSNGKVLTTKKEDYDDFLQTRNWRNVVAVSVDLSHIVGLKSDGTVVAADCTTDPQNGYFRPNKRVDTQQWREIVAIGTGSDYTVGLRRDGTVVLTGNCQDQLRKVSEWHDIVAISAGLFHIVGLKSDGTVVATGANKGGKCDVSQWRDIVAISTSANFTLGLKSDGTVVAAGENLEGRCDVSQWRHIVAIAAGSQHSLGLQLDGTVLATGRNESGQCDVSHWRNVVGISAGPFHSAALTASGEVVATNYKGKNDLNRCNVIGWRLFKDLQNLTNEKQVASRQLADQEAAWRKYGFCQYCGGTFKGLLTRRCASCNTPKDY